MKLYNLYQEVILEEIRKQNNLLTEANTMDTITKAIQDRYEARIMYRDYDDGTPPSYRYVQIYVLGTTKAGNQAIRIFQRGGQSVKTKRGGWKTFRTDRIEHIELANKRFRNPITYGALYKNEPEYNELGDRTFVSIELQVDPAMFTIDKRGLVPIEEPVAEPEAPVSEPEAPVAEPEVPLKRKRTNMPRPEKDRTLRYPDRPERNVISGKEKARGVPTKPNRPEPVNPEIDNTEEEL